MLSSGAADLEGARAPAVDNLPRDRSGPFLSEVLTLGVPDANGPVVIQ
jgi:tRNA-binding protein